MRKYRKPFCDGCGRFIDAISDRFHNGTEAVHSSMIYGVSHDVELCKRCSDFEQDEIDRVGTNDIPELRDRYKNGNLS